MPAPHRLKKLHSLGGEYADKAIAELREALQAHKGDVRATAATLGVHEITVHKWMTAWDMRGPALLEPQEQCLTD
jgi:transcriptional regulator of acetoin/glycerol metabolism